MQWDLGRSIVLTSILRLDDIKVTLRCHAHVSGFVHRDTAAISTTSGRIMQVLGWALDRRMVISNSRLFRPQTMFAKDQSPMEEYSIWSHFYNDFWILLVLKIFALYCCRWVCAYLFIVTTCTYFTDYKTLRTIRHTLIFKQLKKNLPFLLLDCKARRKKYWFKNRTDL